MASPAEARSGGRVWPCSSGGVITPHLARDVSRIETPLFPEVLVLYSKCRSNSPKSLRFVYSQHCVSIQPLNAVGVGSVQIGPMVLATTTELNKVGGLSYGKIATFGRYSRSWR